MVRGARRRSLRSSWPWRGAAPSPSWRERYRALVDDLQYAARRELIFGMHVHVAVDDPDCAVRVVGALQANLVGREAASSFRHRRGRVMDAVSRVEDAVAQTACVQALVAHYVAADRAGEAGPLRHPVLTNENKRRAARYGLQATVIDLALGGPLPITDLIERTLREIAPVARAIGCTASWKASAGSCVTATGPTGSSPSRGRHRRRSRDRRRDRGAPAPRRHATRVVHGLPRRGRGGSTS
jgi:hypothetical protein